MKNKDTGFLGENIATDYLLEMDYQILAKNWRYKHLEIDIIACKAGRLHFIEVKTRSGIEFGYPEQMITAQKMQFLKIAAAHFHYLHPNFKWIQFDVVAIYKKPNLDWALDYFEDVYY
jgi:putative endonuclease